MPTITTLRQLGPSAVGSPTVPDLRAAVRPLLAFLHRTESYVRLPTPAADSLVGPQGAAAIVAPEVRKAVYNRAAEMLRTCTWGVLHPPSGIEPLQRAPKQPTRAVLDVFDEKLGSLVGDPAKGKKVGEGSMEEASVALVGRIAGVLNGPVQRETSGLSEFIGTGGVMWDVKSPRSPRADESWQFDAAHQIDVVKKDVGHGEMVLLNLSRCTAEDARAVIDQLNVALSADERQMVYVLAPTAALG